MPKIKTRKSLSERVKITKNKKILKKKCGQDHFNARESSKKTRNKRRSTKLPKTKTHKTIIKSLPYSK